MRLIQFILIITSFILYRYAPRDYSYTFAILCLIIYLCSAVLVICKNCKRSLLKFEFFFLIAFFFTNYVYAIVFYPDNPYFSLFSLEFNQDYVCKALALSTLGITCFCAGIIEVKQMKQEQMKTEFLRNLKPLIVILMLIFIPYLYSLYQTHEYTTEFESSLVNVVLQFFIYYYLFSYFNNEYLLNKNFSIIKFLKEPIIFLILIYTLLFLSIGSRTIPLRIVLLCLLIFQFFVKRIPNIILLLLMAGGAFIMTVVGVVREGYEFMGLTSIWEIGNDLTINNRSLYVLMEYADAHGYTFGTSMLMQVLSLIPFLQSIFLIVSGMSPDDITSAGIVTRLYFEDSPLDRIGLGTNIIGDIYVAFGMVGVIVMMFLLGKLMKSLYYQSLQGNAIAVLIYALIFMDVIYLPRSSVLGSLRPVFWTYMAYLLSNKYLRKYSS